MILGAPRLTRSVILAGQKLEIIARRGIGVDNIDLRAASERGVVVTNIPGVLSPTTAEHAILLMLGISRKIAVADKSVRNGGWKEFDLVLNPELRGKTLGIIGLGSIGLEVARMARDGFAMKIVTNENPHLKNQKARIAHARTVTLEELLRISDYVLLAVPLTSETEGMIGEKELSLMKPSAFLINISRGKVISEEAMFRVLKDRRIAGAGLDVLAKQPPDPDNPILKLDNVLLTPHCAGLTIETSRELSFHCVDAIARLFGGRMPRKPVRVLNPEVARRYIAKSRATKRA